MHDYPHMPALASGPRANLWQRAVAFALAIASGGGGLLLAIGAVLLALSGLATAELVTGPLLILAGVGFARRRASAPLLVVLYGLIEWIVGLWQVGLDGWALLPRLSFAAALILALFLLPVRGGLVSDALHRRWRAITAPVRATLLALLVGVPLVAALLLRPGGDAVPLGERIAASGPVDWPAFGGGRHAGKFSPLDQIDTGNVGTLELAWQHVEPARPGGAAVPNRKDEATPLMIGDRLYVCTSDNVVIALDAETGRLIWRHDPKVDQTNVSSAICRGVAYAGAQGAEMCSARILMGTIDARLIALDAATGRPCPGFGPDAERPGEVDLTTGMGPVKKGYYYVTSPPTVANGVAVVGGLVLDNQETGEPSGVIRGYDSATGELLWAWDMGSERPARTALAENETYTRGTPNSWTAFSADAELGLVFVPVGNATPDFVGEPREPAWAPFSSALVALDLGTGEPRWHFQTVHHDLWDNDLSSPAVMADLPSAGKTVPVVMFGTKQGQIFVLDRRTGKPFTAVEERPAPQTDVAGEWTSPTQPYSAGMPDLGGARLTDADMWGISPFDRMFCRVKLRRTRYEGPFTPPSLGGSLFYPGLGGGIDWGGMSYDPGRGLLIVPTMHLAQTVTLIPRDTGQDQGNAPQRGTRYSAELAQFMTRLGIPCQRPPFARLTAIDMATRTVVWQRPVGTAEAVGPLGMASRLPLTIGAPPVIGGGIATAGDLTFIAAYADRRLRAIDNRSGRELWSVRLPQGNQATPITYRAPRSGRQMVAMISGHWAYLGNSASDRVHVVAYALPESQ